MSRKDKRSGRASYRLDKLSEKDRLFAYSLNFVKALFGKDCDDEIAPTMMSLALLTDTGATDKKALKVLEDAKRELLQIVKNYASELIERGDGDAFARLARLGAMMNRRSIKQAIDPEAVEIFLAYAKTRLTSGETAGFAKPAPSGKELAHTIDQERKRLGVPVLEKTHDAIRERALRLGLKLKGKRKKKK